jgi:peptide/nickel transport system substrate-binding protein
MMKRRTVFGMLAGLLIGMLLVWAGSASAQTVRAVMEVEVRYLDPHWTTADITRLHGYMVYDTLFALDEKRQPQPQMVDTYRLSADKLTYTFTLRDGLKWHDGKPVRAGDAVPSLKRWAVKSAAGQKLMARAASLEATGEKTFVLKLKEPYGLTIRALATEASYAPFILPERYAVQDPSKPFEGEVIGSGPFMFATKEWLPGAKTVYVKFKDYVPRKEAASYYAGGKKVNVERVEFVVIPDQSTAVAALQKGEVDYLQRPHMDQWPLLRKDSNVGMYRADITQMYIRPNHLAPPFDNVKARQALMLMVNQENYLRAIAGDPENWRTCYSLLGCKGWLETDAGPDFLKKQDLKKARQLLAEAGYKGERIVVMAPSDYPTINAASLTTAAFLRELGVNVDLQAMDWGSLISRRPIKEPPSKNPAGWHIFHSSTGSGDFTNPWGRTSISTECDKAWFGWPCSPQAIKALEELGSLTPGTDAFTKTLTEYHAALMENIVLVPLGEFFVYAAYRKDRLSNIIETPEAVFWNMVKK